MNPNEETADKAIVEQTSNFYYCRFAHKSARYENNYRNCCVESNSEDYSKMIVASDISEVDHKCKALYPELKLVEIRFQGVVVL